MEFEDIHRQVVEDPVYFYSKKLFITIDIQSSRCVTHLPNRALANANLIRQPPEKVLSKIDS